MTRYPEYLVCGKNIPSKNLKIIAYSSAKTTAIRLAKKYKNKYDIVVIYKEIWRSQKISE